MKRTLTCFLLTALLMLSATVQASNDYMEKQKNYMVYAKGPDCIHFRIPYGRGAIRTTTMPTTRRMCTTSLTAPSSSATVRNTMPQAAS